MVGGFTDWTAMRAWSPPLRWGTLVAWLGACLTLALAGCTHPPEKAPPRVVNGMVDVSTWDFEHDGPVKLEGEWEIVPEGTLEDEAVRTPTTNGDFASVPWTEGHHETRSGRDVDDSRWVQLRVTVADGSPARDFSFDVEPVSAEAFHVACASAGERRSIARGGVRSPREAGTFPAGLFPATSQLIHGTSQCILTIPRGAMGRVRILRAPVIDDAVFASRRARERAFPVHANLAMFLTFVVFSATMVATERRDPVARWSLAFGALFLVRLVVTNRGMLFTLGDGGALDGLPWWRVSYAVLWLFVAAFVRYGEALSGRRVPGRRWLFAFLLADAGVASFGSFSLNMAGLPAGQLASLLGVALALRGLFTVPPSTAIVLARAGVAIALVGSVGSVATVQLSGHLSTFFEGLGSTEPFFQMAILAVRAQDARKKSASLARATQRFVPRQFLAELGHDDVTTARLGDAASRRVTVLFADIRDFTSLSERMSPAETFAFLNDCLSRIGPHIRANGGFVDKYIGDAIMALFPGSPTDGVRATVAMQAEVAAANARHPERPPLAIGVGVHVGDVMMGTIGEAERFEATVISDTVNLTARLESLTKQLGCAVLLSGDVFAALDADVREHTRRLGSFVVKGKAQAVELHELFASDPPALRAAKIASKLTLEGLLEAYASGNTVRALDLATELRDACPDDGPANWWFRRLTKECADDDAPPSNGFVVLDAK